MSTSGAFAKRWVTEGHPVAARRHGGPDALLGDASPPKFISCLPSRPPGTFVRRLNATKLAPTVGLATERRGRAGCSLQRGRTAGLGSLARPAHPQARRLEQSRATTCVVRFE